MHGSHAQRRSGHCLAAARQNKARFSASQLSRSPGLDETETSAVSLQQFPQDCVGKCATDKETEAIQWSQVQSHAYAVSEQSCVYEQRRNWPRSSQHERLSEEAASLDRRHVSYRSNRSETYPLDLNLPPASQRHYENFSAPCTVSGLPQPSLERVDGQYLCYEERKSKDHMKTEHKPRGKFAWMKNTKSHHFEWKTQWERGGIRYFLPPFVKNLKSSKGLL